MSYPFPYYGTDPADEQEIIYRVKLSVPPGDDLRSQIISLLPGPPGERFDDRASFLAAIDGELGPGLVHSLWREEWVLVFQDLGEPSAHQDDADMWRQAFERVHEVAPLVEVVSLTGTLSDHEHDAWSAWSLAQQQPSPGPALPFTNSTPWGDLQE
jgi:hypothetical protein